MAAGQTKSDCIAGIGDMVVSTTAMLLKLIPEDDFVGANSLLEGSWKLMEASIKFQELRHCKLFPPQDVLDDLKEAMQTFATQGIVGAVGIATSLAGLDETTGIVTERLEGVLDVGFKAFNANGPPTVPQTKLAYITFLKAQMTALSPLDPTGFVNVVNAFTHPLCSLLEAVYSPKQLKPPDCSHQQASWL